MIVKDVTLLNKDLETIPHRDVRIEDGRYKEIGTGLTAKPGEDIIDGKDKLMMPGFYNTHCHLPMTLTRGLGEGLTLHDWLNDAMFPFEGRMGPEDCYYGALLGIMELLSSGCVSVSDMYFHILEIAEAAHESGIKANISHGLSRNAGTKPKDLKGYKDTLLLIEKVKGWTDGRIKADVGLHAEYTADDELVSAAAELAKNYGLRIHTHISETAKEHEECRERHDGLTPVQYMKSLGIFDVPVLCAHCVYVDDEDMRTIADAGAAISHCVSSNLKLGSGIAPVYKFIERGINTVIATDGASSNNNLNLMEEIHLASLTQKGAFRDPLLLPVSMTLKMATVNGAKAQGREDCGVIEEGYKADFILIDMDKPHLVPRHDIPSNIVNSAQSADIYMTVVDGNVVYKDGEFLKIDRERVMYEAQKCVERIKAEL